MAKATKRADGRLVKTIVDPRTGKRKYFYGDTMREINAKIIEFKSDVEHGRMFEEVAQEWWDLASPDFKLQTLKPYRPAFRRIVDAFGQMNINDVKPRDISLFFGRLAKDGMAQRTVSNHRSILNQIFKHAVLGGELETNPCASVSLPKGLPKTTRHAASKEDEEKVRNDAGAWLFNVIALNTGLRKGEILALQWSDIDLDEDLIYVTKSVAHDGDRPVIDRPKTDAAIRIVPIVPDLKERLLKEPDRSPERFVISDDGNSPLTNRRYQTLSTREKKRAGTTFTAHRLRHSFATNAFEVGLDAKSIQEVIGHKQISTTLNTYTDFRKESVKRAAAVLAKVGEKAEEKDH